jgi:hypothetical protein
MIAHWWPRVAGSLTLVGVLSALAYGLLSILHTPSDAEMLAQFHTHRASFDQLLQMYVEDKPDRFIWVQSTAPGVSAARQQAYPRLMRQVGITGMGVTSWTRSDPPHDLVQFIAQPYRGFIGPEKSWVYTKEPLTWPAVTPLTHGDTAAYRFPPDELWRKVCRPLAAAWYICVDYTD